jgi:hypothetical protein
VKSCRTTELNTAASRPWPVKVQPFVHDRLSRPAGLDQRLADQVPQFPEVVRAVEPDQHSATRPGDPAQLPDGGMPVVDVIGHVHCEGQGAGVITERHCRGVRDDQARSGCPAAGGLQYPGGQVDAQH